MSSINLGLKPIQSGDWGASPKLSESEAAVSGCVSGARSAPASQVTSRPSTPPMERARPERDWPRISNQVFRASLVSTVSRPAAFSVRVPTYSQVVRPGAGNRLRALRRLLAPALWLGLRLLRLRFPRDWFRALLFLRELGDRESTRL